MRQLRIGMSQLNTTVGDFASNAKKILAAIAVDALGASD